MSISCFATTFSFLPSLLEPTSLNLKPSTPEFVSTSYQAKLLYDFSRILDFATIANIFPSLSDTPQGRSSYTRIPFLQRPWSRHSDSHDPIWSRLLYEDRTCGIQRWRICLFHCWNSRYHSSLMIPRGFKFATRHERNGGESTSNFKIYCIFSDRLCRKIRSLKCFHTFGAWIKLLQS